MARLAPGQVWRIGPRYVGAGQYAHDNGTGDVVRLIRPLEGGADWYVTRELFGPLEAAAWDWIMNESRLGERLEARGEVRT